ncbi:MAG: DUF4167 domain-containing protein [Novosphingobium sp.]
MNNNNSNNRGNNNNNNNRRRGRGNRQGGGGGGGQQLNRIDSRARGNAPQLLEKYRKLAQDAHLNGDRVQAEYYLQFADHYFRVTADSRVRQDEQRTRPGERWEGGQGEEGDDGNDFSVESDFPNFDQRYDNRGPREDRPRQDGPREPRRDAEETAGNEAEPSDDSDGEAQPNPYEPPANPFVRDRGRGGLKPRRAPRAERNEADEAELNQTGLDPALLPPAISAARAAAPDDDDNVEAAKPRRGRPRKKPLDGDAGEALETVS